MSDRVLTAALCCFMVELIVLNLFMFRLTSTSSQNASVLLSAIKVTGDSCKDGWDQAVTMPVFCSIQSKLLVILVKAAGIKQSQCQCFAQSSQSNW
jgi:hypothetical protein